MVLDSALRLLESDPAYRFVQDQIFLIREYWNGLDAEGKQAFRRFVDEGRLELIGGLFVQPEVAEPNGECLIRQIIAGQAWQQATFQNRSRIGWFIDTFGQIPQIPQILARAGYSHVVFWRDISPEMDFAAMPADFLWQAPDGTRLRAHWLPGGYSHTPRQTQLVMEHTRTRHVFQTHGGDVVRPNQTSAEIYAEVRERLDSMAYSPDEIGELRLVTASEYFSAVDAEGADFPVLDCDFNPPFYGQDLRGTYDNRIEQKLLNRDAESRMLTAECVAALGWTVSKSYPKPGLDQLWEKLLFCQFHDTVGASSSDPVHVAAMNRLSEVSHSASEISVESLAQLASAPGHGEQAVILFNPLSYPVDQVVELNLPSATLITDSSGRALPAVVTETGLKFLAMNLPPCGYFAFVPDFIMTALKMAEEGNHLIIRGVETSGAAHSVTLTMPEFVNQVWQADLLENPLTELAVGAERGAGQVTFTCAPHEIVTLRLGIYEKIT